MEEVGAQERVPAREEVELGLRHRHPERIVVERLAEPLGAVPSDARRPVVAGRGEAHLHPVEQRGRLREGDRTVWPRPVGDAAAGEHDLLGARRRPLPFPDHGSERRGHARLDLFQRFALLNLDAFLLRLLGEAFLLEPARLFLGQTRLLFEDFQPEAKVLLIGQDPLSINDVVVDGVEGSQRGGQHDRPGCGPQRAARADRGPHRSRR